MKSVIALIVAIGLTSLAEAAPSSEPLVVSTSWLAAHASDKNLVLLHVGAKAEYEARHLPGAHFIQLDRIMAPPVPGGLTLELPTADDFRHYLQELGISDGSRIVVYFDKDRVPSATRLIFTLNAAGLGDRVSLLDGGLSAWEKEGYPTTRDEPESREGVLSPFKMNTHVVDNDFVRAHLHTAGYVLVDARAAAFYDGIQAGGAKDHQEKGHIPGARSIPFSEITTIDQKIKPHDELAGIFKAAGVKPGDHVIAYCHIGQQATAIIFAAREIGVDAVLYDGSFEDWSLKGLPVELPSEPAKP